MTLSYFAAPGIAGPGYGILTDKKIREIENIVCKLNGEDPKNVKKRSRTRNRVLSRQMIFLLLRKHTDLTLLQMGNLYGLEDHSTVTHGIGALNDLMYTDPKVKKQVEYIDKIITEAAK